jgi:hypothetical protein
MRNFAVRGPLGLRSRNLTRRSFIWANSGTFTRRICISNFDRTRGSPLFVLRYNWRFWMSNECVKLLRVVRARWLSGGIRMNRTGIVNTHDAVKPCWVSNLELSIAQRWAWSWSERVELAPVTDKQTELNNNGGQGDAPRICCCCTRVVLPTFYPKSGPSAVRFLR